MPAVFWKDESEARGKLHPERKNSVVDLKTVKSGATDPNVKTERSEITRI